MGNLPRDINHWAVKTKPKQLIPSGGPIERAEHTTKASNTSWLRTVDLVETDETGVRTEEDRKPRPTYQQEQTNPPSTTTQADKTA